MNEPLNIQEAFMAMMARREIERAKPLPAPVPASASVPVPAPPLVPVPVFERPTWRVKATGAVVYASGYDLAKLEPLPEGWWAEQDKQLAVVALKIEASRRIEALGFSLTAQLNAVREGRSNDPRFAAIDAVRTWSNEEETKLKAAPEKSPAG